MNIDTKKIQKKLPESSDPWSVTSCLTLTEANPIKSLSIDTNQTSSGDEISS